MTASGKEINKRVVNILNALLESETVKNQDGFFLMSLDRNGVRGVLKGRRNPTILQLALMVQYFKVDGNYIFGRSEKMFLESTIDNQSNETKQ